MLEGLYSAAAGMVAEQNLLDATSNNISNEDTTGYQSELMGFQDLLYETEAGNSSDAIVGTGAASEKVGYSQAQGSLEETGDALDVALDGDGYFEIRLDDGKTGLTRNGTFQLNAKGQITTTSGQPLQPSITVPKGTSESDIAISSTGVVSVNGKRLGKLSIVEVPDADQLTPVGDSDYVATTASGAPTAAKGVTVQQGYLESSNVDLSVEIGNMEDAEQGYEMDSKAISIEYQLGNIAATLK